MIEAIIIVAVAVCAVLALNAIKKGGICCKDCGKCRRCDRKK